MRLEDYLAIVVAMIGGYIFAKGMWEASGHKFKHKFVANNTDLIVLFAVLLFIVVIDIAVALYKGIP